MLGSRFRGAPMSSRCSYWAGASSPITGEVAGPLWGTDVYTGDSAIAVAAVHAGLVKAGDSAIVKVTVEHPLPRYAGSVQNGVTSHEFGPYGTAFRLAAV